MNRRLFLAVSLIIIMPLMVSAEQTGIKTHNIVIEARQYAYSPSRIVVNKGDRIRLKIKSLDVVHGFYLEGYNLNIEVTPEQNGMMLLTDPNGKEVPREVNEIVFTADKAGKFRYRCSHTCGSLHPFMLGEFIVKPNIPFYAGITGIFAIFVVISFISLQRKGKQDGTA